MFKLNDLVCTGLIYVFLIGYALCQGIGKEEQEQEIARQFEKCHTNSSDFDPCMKTAFNGLRVYFKTGLYFFNFIIVNVICMCCIEKRFNVQYIYRLNIMRLCSGEISDVHFPIPQHITHSKITSLPTPPALIIQSRLAKLHSNSKICVGGEHLQWDWTPPPNPTCHFAVRHMLGIGEIAVIS